MAEYQKQITRLELAKNVTVVDEYLPNELLAAYIKRANVVVLPYRSATQSGIIQIAFGLNTPVITTNVGGLAEAVEDGRTGLVVPPEDPLALAEAIERYFAQGLEGVFSKDVGEGNGRFLPPRTHPARRRGDHAGRGGWQFGRCVVIGEIVVSNR